jgi:hypothetical protein
MAPILTPVYNLQRNAAMPYEQARPAPRHYRLTAPVARPQRRWIRGEKIGPAFWTIAGMISMIVNLALIVLIVVLGRQLFGLKALVETQVLGGLYDNFVLMDAAHIRTTIPVSAEVPAKFDLALNTHTTVVLTEDTHLPGATIYELNAGGMLYIPRASTNIILPAGTRLPVALNLTVPVDQQIPVHLNVEVDIPLSQTELHEPFVGLREVVRPYHSLLRALPNSWQEALCGSAPSALCLRLAP